MSKFIRTKEGRIYDLQSKEVSSWEYIDNNTAINEYGVEGAFYTIYYFDENKGHYSECDGKGGHSCVFIEEKDILKQADTIEELCDEFVLYFDCEDDKIRNRYMIEDELDDVNARLDIIRSWNEHEEPKVIYGAIWTDKGLIFVAKMNEKGDLELI